MRFFLRALLTIFFISPLIQAQEHSIMTFNIRYATENDGINQWENRKDWVSTLIQFYEPDVFGVQEGLQSQVVFLDDELVKYDYVGVGRDDGETSGEYAAIFFKSGKLEVLDSGTFWLSETPDEPSFGWGANFRRIATWAKFKVKETGMEYLVFNAHLDHEVAEARLNSVKLIREKADDWGDENLPVFVIGDLNARPDSPPIEYLSSVYKDAKDISEYPAYGPEGTFNGFDTSHPLDARIDYIFVNEKVRVYKYAVLADTQNERTPSDHLPVFIQYSLK
ncbi:MAG: endonuclease/exonuclease/phosphatase family protein [Balneolaceae bacterium]